MRASEFREIIQQQACWIAINPAQGCPKDCSYCFLRPWGQTRVAPVALMGAIETVAALLDSKFYTSKVPLCFLSHTDPMATASNRTLLIELLSECMRKRLNNPCCFVTKCHIPDPTLESLTELNKQGAKLVVYLSYSGLGPDLERGINHGRLKDNFARVAAAGIPIVHYWRPILPNNASKAALSEVHAFASKYASCSVATGLKVYSEMLEDKTFWPKLHERRDEAIAAECNWPAKTRARLHDIYRSNRSFPIFFTNSCALSWVFREPDQAGYYRSDQCRQSGCPRHQRRRCSTLQYGRKIEPSNVLEILTRFGLDANNFQITCSASQPLAIIVGPPLDVAIVASIRRELRCSIKAQNTQSNFYWSSATAGAKAIEIDNENNLSIENED